MADAQIYLSYTALGEMLNADFMVAEMERRAKMIEEWAFDRAPVYSGRGKDDHRGRYKASFSSGAFPHGGVHGDRAEGWVENTAPEALYVEYGNRGREPYHLMLRALYEGGHD